MTNEQQALADMPILMVIILSLVGGISGEMWRADKDGARGWALWKALITVAWDAERAVESTRVFGEILVDPVGAR